MSRVLVGTLAYLLAGAVLAGVALGLRQDDKDEEKTVAELLTAIPLWPLFCLAAIAGLVRDLTRAMRRKSK